MSLSCPNCAAPARAPDQARCAFCGHALPQPEAAPGPASVPELLASVERHPDLAAWMAHTPSAARHAVGLGAMVTCGILFAGVALAMMVFFASFAGPLALFLLLFVAAGVAMAITGAAKGAQLSAAMLERSPALVVDERTEVRGGDQYASATTRYFATLERIDGRRSEHEVDSRLSGQLAPGDYGLAYVRAGYLLDFRRVGSR